MDLLLGILIMALGALGIVVVHALGRYAFARAAQLPIERARLRVFVRLAGPGRTGGRLGALAAGLLAAYLGVAAIAFAFASCAGVPAGEPVLVVAEILEGYDAAGKLQPGDRIVAVDGEPIVPGRGRSLPERVAAKQGAPVTLTVGRAGARREVAIQPRQGEVAGGPRWLLGIRQRREQEHATDAATAAAYALRAPIEQARAILTEELAPALGAFRVEVSAPDPGGPVHIVDELRAPAPLAALVLPVVALGAAYAMLALAILDLLRAAAIARERRSRA